jgi:large subunit ribosomal protein L23
MASIPNILRRPLVLTEKGTNLKEEHNQVLFEVSREATKYQIRAAVEAAFNVKVTNVRTMIVRGKAKRNHSNDTTLPGAPRAADDRPQAPRE